MRTSLIAAAFMLPLALSACAGGFQNPSQPTPAGIESTVVALQAITADPVSAFKAGDYAARAACHAAMNAAAVKSGELNQASALLGAGGAALSVPFPPAGGAASLVQMLLGNIENAGPAPYSPAVSQAVQDAMDAYEAGALAAPPGDVATAASEVDDLWELCTVDGIERLSLKALSTAQISATVTNAGLSAQSLLAPRAAPVSSGRPHVTVNGR